MSEVLFVLFLPGWFAVAIAATMGLANTPAWWAPPALAAVWLYPVALVGVSVLAHLLLRRWPVAAHVVNLVPLLWVLPAAALLAWVALSELSQSL